MNKRVSLLLAIVALTAAAPPSGSSSSSLTDGQITTTGNPVHDVHTMAMVKTKGKPAREAQRRLTDGEIGSWTALKTAIEIEGGFSGTITLAANFDCDYNSQIYIGAEDPQSDLHAQDVTIHANGAVCNAQQEGRFFWVYDGATLTLNGMTLKNG